MRCLMWVIIASKTIKGEQIMLNEIIKKENELKIEQKIYNIRGLQVMLDSDIADLFGVETRRLNEQMRRNLERFPGEFCFQLNSNEFIYLKSQNAISSFTHGGVRKLPYVYTEHGVIALAGVLKSETAAKMSVEIVKAFVAMRKFILDNGDTLLKLAQLQNRQINFEIETNKRFDEVLDLIDKKDLPKQAIFFEGQYFDAFEFVEILITKAKCSLILIDPYCDSRALSFLKNKNVDVQLTIVKSDKAKLTHEDISIFESQYGHIEVIERNDIHDRFLIIDNKECYSLGASLNYAGKKMFAVCKIDNLEIIKSIVELVNNV